MRFPNHVLGSLVLIISMQPLFGQTTAAKAQANTGSAKTNKFDLAQSSGFDFARTSELMDQANRLQSQLNAERLRNPSMQQQNNDVCYTMRVYNFKRQDGDAPEMTDSTTCTPANRANPRSIEGASPKARYVPQ